MSEMKKAVSAWKTHRPAGSGLSSAARNRVLRSAMAGPDARDLPRISNLFPAYSRLALAAFLPVCLLAVVLALTLGGSPGPVSITAEKVGDQVVFSIANGGRAHSISKSNTPHTFDPGKSVRVQDGSYREPLIENGDLVFYRID